MTSVNSRENTRLRTTAINPSTKYVRPPAITEGSCVLVTIYNFGMFIPQSWTKWRWKRVKEQTRAILVVLYVLVTLFTTKNWAIFIRPRFCRLYLDNICLLRTTNDVLEGIGCDEIGCLHRLDFRRSLEQRMAIEPTVYIACLRLASSRRSVFFGAN